MTTTSPHFESDRPSDGVIEFSEFDQLPQFLFYIANDGPGYSLRVVGTDLQVPVAPLTKTSCLRQEYKTFKLAERWWYTTKPTKRADEALIDYDWQWCTANNVVAQ